MQQEKSGPPTSSSALGFANDIFIFPPAAPFTREGCKSTECVLLCSASAYTRRASNSRLQGDQVSGEKKNLLMRAAEERKSCCWLVHVYSLAGRVEKNSELICAL